MTRVLFRKSFSGKPYSWIIDEIRLWNVSFSLTKNWSFGLILLVAPFLLDHSIDFNIPLAQTLVSTMWPPKSFNFDWQFASITSVSIVMTIFLEITTPDKRTPVTTSFTFTRNSSDKRFLFFAQSHYHYFCLFQFFLSVIFWCSYKRIFRIFFSKFARLRFCSIYLRVFADLILNALWKWSDVNLPEVECIILSR